MLLKKVIDLQRDAQEALTEEMPNSSRLESLLEFGTSLDVELPEVPKLKQVQCWWNYLKIYISCDYMYDFLCVPRIINTLVPLNV